MQTVNCPFCGAEISMGDVDKNAGACPECDALVTGSLLFDDISADADDDFDEFDEDLDFDEDDLIDDLEDDDFFEDDDDFDDYDDEEEDY